MTIRTDLVIVGAGPTGLGALQRFFELQSENYIGRHTKVLVIESESEAGGLSRTVTDENGFRWDMGVHIIGSPKFPAFLKMLNDTIPEWNEIKRCIKADITIDDGEIKYAPYPVQNSLHHLPRKMREECLAQLERRKFTELDNSINFGEFSRLYFGDILQSIFIKPYNEKVWTVKLEQMNCRWIEGRVPKIDLALLRRRCKSPVNVENDDDDELRFRYPANSRGIGEVWTRLADNFPQKNFLYNTKVIGIDTKEKQMLVRNLKTNEESVVHYELMISTMPIIELNKMCNLFADLKLVHSTVVLVGIALKKPQNKLAKQLTWAYYPRQCTSFYRCTVLSNFSSALTPDADKYWSVLCEIGRQSGTEIESKEEITRKVVQNLINVKIIDSEEQVYSTYLCVIPYGYPVPTLNRDEELLKYQNAFENCQIFSRGRFGQWKYELSNTEYCFEIGRQVVEKLYLDVDERLC